MISEVALKRLGLDKVWWIVSPGNPLKQRTERRRWRSGWCCAATMAKNPHIVVTDFEADLPTPYTASTLAFLKTRSPLVRYVWIMGADNLATFDRWQRWREIFTTVPIVVVDRPGWRMKALASKAARAFAAAARARVRGRAACRTPGAGLDLPDRSAVACVLDGAAQQGQAPRRLWPKSHSRRRAALEEGRRKRAPTGLRRPR